MPLHPFSDIARRRIAHEGTRRNTKWTNQEFIIFFVRLRVPSWEIFFLPQSFVSFKLPTLVAVIARAGLERTARRAIQSARQPAKAFAPNPLATTCESLRLPPPTAPLRSPSPPA